MTKYKAVFFDIDGTLVSFRTHKVPESACKAIGKLNESGIRTFISSGRHLWAINNLGDLKFDGYITINGGITKVADHVISKTPISRADIVRLNDYIEHVHRFPCIFALEDRLVLNYYNEQVYELFDLLNFPDVPTADLRTLEQTDVYQAIAFFDEVEEPRIMSVLTDCASARWHPMFSDVVPRGQSKVKGMEAVCNYYGIDKAETIAFGDGGNDIEMLRWAGCGIAMGNAEDKVKAAADLVTDSVDDDGVWNALQKLCFAE